MAEYGFAENLDWKRVSQKCPTLGGEQEMVDYQISVDMAKQICMIQRTEKGKTVPGIFSGSGKSMELSGSNYGESLADGE